MEELMKTEKDESGFSMYSMNDLLMMNIPEAQWAWDGIFPVGGLSLVVGQPKAGKTTFLRSLCLAVARGEDFLGRSTMKGPVILFGLEEHKAHLKDYFYNAGAENSDDLHIIFGDIPYDAFNKLKGLIVSRSPSMVVIDTLFKFKPIEDTNSYAQTSKNLLEIMNVARETNTAIVLVHHMRKNDADSSTAILGSQGIFGGVDTAFYLSAKNNMRFFSTTQRFGENIEETIINFDKDINAFSLGEKKQVRDEQSLIDLVIPLLVRKPLCFDELFKRIGGNKGALKSVLNTLGLQKIVHKNGTGKRGSPYVYSIPDSELSYIEESLVQSLSEDLHDVH